MEYISKNGASIFSKFSYPSSGQNQKCTMGFSSCKKLIALLVQNFKVIFSVQLKVRKIDFFLVLARKQKRYRSKTKIHGLDRFRGNGPYCKILTKKEPIKAQGFA